MAKLKKRSKT